MKLREVSNLDDELCEGLERTEFCQGEKPPKNPSKTRCLRKIGTNSYVFFGGGMFLLGGSHPQKSW